MSELRRRGYIETMGLPATLATPCNAPAVACPTSISIFNTSTSSFGGPLLIDGKLYVIGVS